jgi:membrane fusion protein
MYRISVKLASQSLTAYGRKIALRPGLTLEADVLQDTRKIWEWILEPLIATSVNVRAVAGS